MNNGPYCYVLDEDKIIVNIIVLDESEDPSIFNAVFDYREFNIGDRWIDPTVQLCADMEFLAALQGIEL